MQIAKQTIVVELENLGYTEKQVKEFQKTAKCPHCGMDFSNLPFSGRWIAHLANCDGKKSKSKKKR